MCRASYAEGNGFSLNDKTVIMYAVNRIRLSFIFVCIYCSSEVARLGSKAKLEMAPQVISLDLWHASDMHDSEPGLHSIPPRREFPPPTPNASNILSANNGKAKPSRDRKT